MNMNVMFFVCFFHALWHFKIFMMFMKQSTLKYKQSHLSFYSEHDLQEPMRTRIIPLRSRYSHVINL